MNNFIKHLGNLYENELYSNVIRVCEITTSICEQKPECFTTLLKYQLYMYYAESFYRLQRYLEAENTYRQLLQLRKYINKNRIKLADAQSDLMSDVEIKYKIYLCCVKLKQMGKAVEILQSIPPKSRSAKINMALASVFWKTGLERAAIAAYKEVLRENPLALEAAEYLLKSGVNGVEVNSLMLDVTSDITWMNTWLRAQAHYHTKDYASAITTFKSLDVNGLLKDNATLLVNTAYCYNYLCDEKKAISYLQRAVRVDPNLREGRDLLSTLLTNSGNKECIPELEKLSNSPLDMTLWGDEQWVVLGNYMYAIKKYDKAAYFGQQAIQLNYRNVEGLLLKANTLVQINKYQEAARHCVEALQYASNRFEIHKCLIETYLRMNRLREADNAASAACKQLNYSAQSLTLHASVLAKDPVVTNKMVRRLLEKAVAKDPTYSTAVCLLASYLDREQLYEEEHNLLVRHLDICPTSGMHQLLADCLVNLRRDEEAFHHYNMALSLDPNNQRAIEGLNNIGVTNKRDSYYTTVGEQSSCVSQGASVSDHEPDPESDNDLWPTAIAFD